MRQVLRAGALGRPKGMGWGGRWEGGSGCRTHVNPWLIHVNVWQKPLQYYKVNSPQLIKINEKKIIMYIDSCLVTKSCLTLTVACQAPLSPWDFPGKNIGVGCHFLLQGIFLTQGSNPCLLPWQANSLPLSHQGSPVNR